MDSTFAHFIQLLIWLACALFTFSVSRWIFYQGKKYEPALSTPYLDMYTSASFTQWARKELTYIDRANSFVVFIGMSTVLFYLGDIGDRFGNHDKTFILPLCVYFASAVAISAGSSISRLRQLWEDSTVFRVVSYSLYTCVLLTNYIFICVDSGDDYPIYLIGLGICFAIFLLTYICLLRHSTQEKVGMELWGFSILSCLISNGTNPWIMALYAFFYGHFTSAAARYAPPFVFFPLQRLTF